ncbi:MAG: DUF2807 domain-containing protein [Anaerolineae bacterium]|nr:DUF2807 domain-containing protein [Anaerolineae bacterium]
MEKPGLILVLIILGLSAMGCTAAGTFGVKGSGNVRTEVHEIHDFTSVNFASIGELTIEQGEEEGLRIEAEDNLLPYFETEIHDGELIIRQSIHTPLHPTQAVRFYLKVKSLEALALTGSGSAAAEQLHAEQLTLRLTGSGNINLGHIEADTCRVWLSGSGDVHIATLNATEMETHLTGSGNMRVTGAVSAQELALSGSGNYLADTLQSNSAVLRLTGSGSAHVRVAEQLEAQLTGSGSIIYSGTPTVQSVITGSGKISTRSS